MERILKIAHNEFLKNGFKNTTVDYICEQCGISKKTLYENFENKNELISHVIEKHSTDLTTKLDFIASNSKNAIEEIYSAFEILVDNFKQLNIRSIFELKKYYFNEFKAMEKFQYTVLPQYIKQNILRGKTEGYYRTEINEDILSHYRIESLFNLLSSGNIVQLNYSLLEINKEILLNFYYGIATNKGIAAINKSFNKYFSK